MTEPANRPRGETDPIFGQPTPDATVPPPPWATLPPVPPDYPSVEQQLAAQMPVMTPPPTKSHAGAWIAGVLVAVMVVVLVAIAASGSKDTPYLPPPTDTVATTDFHDVATLQASMTDTIDSNILNAGKAGAVTSVICVPGVNDNQFVCNVAYTDNSSDSVTVTVSPDGQTWVSQ